VSEEILELYARRVGYSAKEKDVFREGGHRPRLVERLGRAARRHVIEVEVLEARHCNSGHVAGQKLVLDVAGNLIAELCPGGCASTSSPSSRCRWPSSTSG